jgi:hypothetical protein
MIAHSEVYKMLRKWDGLMSNVIAQARRDKTSDEIKHRYESTKRSRKFNQNWKNSFP